MSDIESRISRNVTQPKRPLPKNFTNETMSALQTRRSWRSRKQAQIKDIYTMKHTIFNKPALLLGSLLLLAGLGGTAYAIASNWPETTAKTQTVKVRQNGNRIVEVSLKNCIDAATYQGSTGKPDDRRMYFEVAHNAPLSNSDLQAAAVDNCNSNAATSGYKNMIGVIDPSTRGSSEDAITAQKFKYGSETGTVVAITADTITYTIVPFGGAGGTDSPNAPLITKTTNLSPSVKYFNYTQQATKDTIKPGDTIAVALQAQGKLWPEFMTNNSMMNQPGVQSDQIKVVGIMKYPGKSNAVAQLEKKYGEQALQNFAVGAGPCHSDPDGYCHNYFPEEIQRKQIEPINKYINPFN